MTCVCIRCHEEKKQSEMCKDYKTGGYRGHCQACENHRAREYRKNNGARYLSMAKDYSRKKLYGLTRIEYARLCEKYPMCPICGKEFTEHFVPHVDHDHVTGEVRGLLCKFCNPGLGSFKEDVSILERAISYLKSHKVGLNAA